MKDNFMFTAYGVALLLAGFAVYAAVKGAKSVLPAALDSINPANNNNIAAQASNWIAQKVSGDPSITTGSYIYDLLHPSEGAQLTAPTIVKRSTDATDNYGAQVLQDRQQFMY